MGKIAEKLFNALYEELPKNAKQGQKYKKVMVDGETFKDLTLANINPNKSELIFMSSKKDKHTFNYSEQEIKLTEGAIEAADLSEGEFMATFGKDLKGTWTSKQVSNFMMLFTDAIAQVGEKKFLGHTKKVLKAYEDGAKIED